VGMAASVPATQVPLDEASLRLVVRRKMYDGATATANSTSLAGLPGDNDLRLHPLDFQGLSIREGDRVTVVSERGSIELPAFADAGVVRGTVTVLANVPGATVNHLLSSSNPVTDVRLEVSR